MLLASATVFAKGFSQASVAAIVKAAGTSRRTFYEHFDDLVDCLVQLYDAAANILFKAVESAGRSASDPREMLERSLEAYLLTISANADLARIVYGEIRAAGPDHVRRYQATVARFARLIGAWAEFARSAGIIRRVPDEIDLYTLVHGIEGIAVRYVYSGRERKLPELRSRLVEFVLASLA